jgi:hypothetical protein
MVYWSWSRRYAGGMPLDSCSPTSMTGAARRHVMPPDCRRPLVSSLVLSLAARKRLKMPSRPAGMDERIGRPVGAQSLAAFGQAPIAAHPDRIVAFGAAAPGTLSPEPREAGVEPPASNRRRPWLVSARYPMPYWRTLTALAYSSAPIVAEIAGGGLQSQG